MIPWRIPSRIHTQLRWAIVAAAMFARTRTALPQQPAAPHATPNATVLGVASGAVQTGMSVLTGVGRIVPIGRRFSIRRDELRADGKGKFLIPGLWDMRSHPQLTGVVGARDMGSDADSIYPIRDRVHRGESTGPEIAAAGPIAPPKWEFGGRPRIQAAHRRPDSH